MAAVECEYRIDVFSIGKMQTASISQIDLLIMILVENLIDRRGVIPTQR